MNTHTTALIIGAGGGIGRPLCLALARQGVQVLLAGRKQNVLEALHQDMTENTHNPHRILVADICTDEGRATLISAARDFQASLIINLSGINQLTSFQQQESNAVKHTIETNLLAPMLLTHGLLPVMQNSHHQQPQIIHIGSTLGSIGMPGYTSYCSSKFGLYGFTQALSRELSDQPVRIRYFAPRTTKTDINSEAANDLNAALGNTSDSPETVAHELISFIATPAQNKYLGWPEKLFIKLNAVWPELVSQQLRKKLPLIRQYIG